jgi:2-methylisocitrate lyase-like PEP mutase family enzyme
MQAGRSEGAPVRIGPRADAARELRTLLARERPLLALGAFNAVSARVVEAAGFPVVYLSGYHSVLALLGMPDAGLATATEMAQNARWVVDAVSVPVIADADDGYGNAVNVMRTVRDYVRAGVAALHLEDQEAPKRCGHVAGRRVLPLEEAVGKLRAADRVRRSLAPDLVLIARTDARGAAGGGLDDAIRRANAYVAAGADLAFVEGLVSEAELRRVVREVRGPVLYNQTGLSPRLTAEALRDLGVALAIFPGALSRVSVQAMYDFALDFRHRGPVAEAELTERTRAHPLGSLHEFAGFGQVRRWEAEFLPPEAADRYAGTLGHQPGQPAAGAGTGAPEGPGAP